MVGVDRVAVAVVGGSGYSGAELLRLLACHPRVQVATITANDAAGSRVGQVYPHLRPFADRTFEPVGAVDPGAVGAAFVALPPGESARIIPDLVEAGVRVVDLGGDFRLPADAYPRWYGFEHPAPAWLDKAAYGLTELFREQIVDAQLVANPGCYPTPAVLGLGPLLRAGLILPGGLVVDGKSGISGAGKRPTAASHFAALDGSVQAYRVGRHQHTPEIERAIGMSARVPVTLTFVPHLVPTVRGIVTTAYARLMPTADPGALRSVLASAYEEEPFVRVVPAGAMPDPKRVLGSNVCELGVEVDEHAGTAVVVGAIDNLGKGAAGQAVQNLNLMFGFDETDGLSTVGVYP
jgi:N-acetyl-gamma-glutamyl-phosphate reductase